MKMMKDDFKAVSVLASDYCAYDLADHLADVLELTPSGRVWDMDAMTLAMLAVDVYPGGAVGLLLELMGEE